MEKCIFKMQPPARISQSLAFLFLQLPLAMHLLPALFFVAFLQPLATAVFEFFDLIFFFFLGDPKGLELGRNSGLPLIRNRLRRLLLLEDCG